VLSTDADIDQILSFLDTEKLKLAVISGKALLKNDQ
jgi:hypothetical protein